MIVPNSSDKCTERGSWVHVQPAEGGGHTHRPQAVSLPNM